jgi:c-di-AMP phosphodiesterase-like protein
MERHALVANAQECGCGIVLAVSNEQVDRITAAKAADDLLDISGVKASVVAFRNGEDTLVSARSTGKVNVQVLMEKLGGGGNLGSAGAQLRGVSEEEAEARIRNAIRAYLKDTEATVEE